VGTIEDIHEGKVAQVALLESERRQRLAIDAARMALWEYDIATETIAGSPELNRLFGFPQHEARGIADFVACYLPGERERVRRAGLDAIESGEPFFEVEFRIRVGGSPRWVLLRAEVIKRADGTFERVIGVIMDIEEHKKSAEAQRLLVRELNHRVKNSLSVVQAIAGQTFRAGIPHEQALAAFNGRLGALAAANEIAVQGDRAELGLRTLIEQIVAPYRDAHNDPFDIVCGAEQIPGELSSRVALALHELCTNAAKYGALSVPAGRVLIRCREADETVTLSWKETGGPQVEPVSETGFGTRLLTRILARDFLALDLVFEPDGLRCDMEMPRK
jgi:PAS domain S-box-containing protein